MAGAEVSSMAMDWMEYLGQNDALLGSVSEANKVWLLAGICSALVGLSGLLPVIFLNPNNSKPKAGKEQQRNLATDNNGNNQDSASPTTTSSNSTLKFMLSFAVGSLLGDVFLHLLPEAYEKLFQEVQSIEDKQEALRVLNSGQLFIGLWTVVGLLTFVAVEMVFNADSSDSDSPCDGKEGSQISVSGYLNLLANCIDNFCHGLAVGAAFLVSAKVGIVTTICILLHEIPHEIGDFAILLNSGFSRYEAAKAQFSTAALGILGAFFALALDSYVPVDSITAWIIPFTCGGFLNIAMVTVLPDLLKSKDRSDCFKTLSGIVLGLMAMTTLSKL